MSSPFRISLFVAGLAAVVSAAASLTGNWLLTPPWWERTCTWLDFDAILTPHRREPLRESDYRHVHASPRPGREQVSVGVVGAGLGLVAVGVWPRRRHRGARS